MFKSENTRMIFCLPCRTLHLATAAICDVSQSELFCRRRYVRLHHHRSWVSRMRAGQSPLRASGGQGSAARSRRPGHQSVHSYARRCRQIVRATRELAVLHQASENLDNRSIWYPQGRTLGGSSSINAMVYIRGQREDYDHWAELGNEGWSYADVLPYFRRSEDNERFANAYHGQGGPLWVSDQIGPHELSRAFVRACQGWGLPYNPDFNGAEQYGAGFYQVTCRHGRRRSAAVSYLWPVLSRPNLTVLTHARAVKIPIENGRAIGVEIARKGSITTARCRREVIVSSGAINSPRLLILLSYSFFQFARC